MNDIYFAIYQGISNTIRYDRIGDLQRAQLKYYSTTYPRGLYTSMELFIPRDPAAPVWWVGGDRIVARNGLKIVWEGRITATGYSVGQNNEGVSIRGVGMYGDVLGRRMWDKRWADNRIGFDTWIWDTTNTGAELATEDRYNRIRITPKAEAWANGDIAGIDYTMPTGETIKRVVMNYDMQESGQAWELRLRNVTGAADIWSVTASGTGSQDLEAPGDFTAVQNMEIQFIARAAQTPTADGTYYGQISSVMMYSEVDTNITAGVIAADVLTEASDINSYTGLIGDPALALEPFYTDGPENLASILERAVSFGDASFNSWCARLVSSELATSPDGKPVLEVAQYPALTSYDYVVSLDDPNLVGDVEIIRDIDGVVNWVAVVYRDDANKTDVVLTPDDDSTLTDSTSVATYGTRALEKPIYIGVGTSALALNIGKRYLASNKDPKFFVGGPITVAGYIRDINGGRVQACEIEAGKRVKIITYLEDLTGTAGAGLTQLITDTRYYEDEGGEFCTINLEGLPDDLSILLAQRSTYGIQGLQL